MAAAVALLAAAWFWLGTRLTLEWVDQGQIVYGAWRFARGDLPYRDFDHVYGPSLFLLNGALLRWFGEDLMAVRLGLLATKAMLAALIFVVSRAVARTGIALAVTAWFIAVWGAPLWLYATPYAGHYALACSLAGLAILLARRGGGWRLAFAAGVCVGLGATFKQTTGLFGAAGILVVLASSPVAGDTRDDVAGVARWLRLVVVVAVASMAIGYLSRALATWSGAVLLGPVLAGLSGEWWRDRRVEPLLPAGRPRVVDTLVFGTGFAVPLALWIAAYAARGAVGDLVHDTVAGLPQLIDWSVPFGVPDIRTVVLGAALVGGGLGVAAARSAVVVVAGLVVGGLALVSALAPLGAATAMHTMRLLPLLVTCAAAPVALARREAIAHRLVWWFAAFASLSLHPGADLPHALMVLPALLPALAMLLDEAWTLTRDRPLGRAAAAVCVVGSLAVHGAQSVTILGRAMAARPPAAPTFDRALGVWDQSPEFRNMLDVVAQLDRLQPRGTPLLVVPSAQLLYMLADRPSALPHAEMILYLLSIDAMRPEAARALLDEDDLMLALDAQRPSIVRLPGPAWERIAVTFPRLARRIEETYVETARVGRVRLLAPRGG
jgi:hypothetical protein